MLTIYSLFTQTHLVYSLGTIKNWIYGVPLAMTPIGYQLLFFSIVIFIAGTFFLIQFYEKNILIYSSFTIQLLSVVVIVVSWILLSTRNNLGPTIRFENQNGLTIFGILLFFSIISTCISLYHLKFGFMDFSNKVNVDYYSLISKITKLWKKNERLIIYPLLGLLIILSFITHMKNIFIGGFPATYDDITHMYNTALVAKQLYPGWDSGWYCGRPPFLFYPPLSYGIAAIPNWLVGVNIFTSYDGISLLFYSILPLALFLLAKECGLSHFYSFLSALFLAMSYVLNRAYMLYGQYPTIVGLFFLFLTLMMFIRFLKADNGSKIFPWIGMTLFSTATLLSHHQTGYFLIFSILMTVSILSYLKRRISFLIFTTTSILFTVGLSSFWLIPMFNFLDYGIQASTLGTDFNFQAILLHPSKDIYEYVLAGLGIHIFFLALLTVLTSVFLYFSKNLVLKLKLAILLWVGSSFFLIAYIWPTISNFGILLILFLFAVFYILIQNGIEYKIIVQKNELLLKRIFVLIPFFIFGLILGIGPPDILDNIIPFYNVVSLERFIFYSLGLGCILAVVSLKMLIDSAAQSKFNDSRKNLLSILLMTLILTSFINAYKIEPSATYIFEMKNRSKIEIPDDIISYFQKQLSHDHYGRILPINMPKWIYIFPSLIDIPIVDGWYPTSRLAIILNKFPSSEINHPEGPGINDTEVWEYHIQKSEDLGVLWIITKGKSDNIESLNENFTLDMKSGDYYIWKYKTKASMIKITEEIRINYTRHSATIIEIQLETKDLKKIDIVIRETYFPHWHAYLNGEQLSVKQDDNGYLSIENLKLNPGQHKVMLIFESPFNYGIIISLFSIILIIGIMIFKILYKRKTKCAS